MLSIEEVYQKMAEIGCCSFATLDGDGVDSRIAHFFAFDDEGLYLRTMTVKPFFRQLLNGGKLSVCGEKTEGPCTWDEDHMPHFQPGYMMRMSGDVRLLSLDETKQKEDENPMFHVSAYDRKKYPETRVFVLHRAWGELYNYDFNLVHMDHKILRERFGWGGARYEEPGLMIDGEICISCGKCALVCTHRAIVPGEPYSIRGAWCDECGNCWHVCPVGAVISKGPGEIPD